MIKEADLEERVLAKHGFSFALKNLLTHFLLPPEFHLFFFTTIALTECTHKYIVS